ncbi:MAG: hypothetical protein PVS3B3_06470 [Ktedonobacteraceae bacterium]
MLTTHLLLATGPLLEGNFLGTHFVITTSQVIYFMIAAVVGLIAEFLVGWRLPFGILGAFVAALIGIWLFTSVIQVTIPGDFTIAGQPIPLLKSLLGAIVVVALWHALTYRGWSRRHRYYRGRRENYGE